PRSDLTGKRQSSATCMRAATPEPGTAFLGAFGEIETEPCGRAVRPRCGVLGCPDSTTIGAPCVLASRAPIAPARRAPFRQRPLALLQDLDLRVWVEHLPDAEVRL